MNSYLKMLFCGSRNSPTSRNNVTCLICNTSSKLSDPINNAVVALYSNKKACPIVDEVFGRNAKQELDQLKQVVGVTMDHVLRKTA